MATLGFINLIVPVLSFLAVMKLLRKTLCEIRRYGVKMVQEAKTVVPYYVMVSCLHKQQFGRI